MRIPNWLALIGAIICCLGMIGATHDDYIKGHTGHGIVDGILAFLWLLCTIHMAWRTYRHPNATFGRLWSR